MALSWFPAVHVGRSQIGFPLANVRNRSPGKIGITALDAIQFIFRELLDIE
jgi:hypothetical protein